MTVPKRLMIEFEDGSKKAIDFSQLARPAWLELSRMGLCLPPPPISESSRNYLLLRWKNGWQEVIGVDKNSVDLLRYYILERMEEVGRIVLNANEDYPILLTVNRLPKELDRLMIVGGGNTRGYHLEPSVKKEEGDKIEHVEYDKAERYFQPQPEGQGEVWLTEVIETLKNELSQKGLSAEKLLNEDPINRVREYKDLAKVLPLRATEKQEDVYGLIQLMIEKMVARNR
jgi:hypothetical protein